MITSQLGTVDSYLGNILLGGVIVNLEQEISQTLALVQEVGLKKLVHNPRQTLALVQTVQANTVRERALANTLSFLQILTVVKTRLVNQTIVFDQETDIQQTKGVKQTLALVQSITKNYAPHHDNQGEFFEIVQTIGMIKSYRREAENELIFVQTPSLLKIKHISVAQTFVMSHNAVPLVQVHANNVIVFNQDVNVFKILHRSLSNTLALNQTITKRGTWTRNVNQTLELRNGRTKQDGSIVVSVPGAQITKKQNVVLLEVPGKILLLPKPLYNNVEQPLNEIEVKHATDGTKYTYVKRNEKIRLAWTFQIKTRKAEEVKDFMEDYLSSIITIKDWKGQIWCGYILTNPLEITNSERWGQHEFDFEFEGLRIN